MIHPQDLPLTLLVRCGSLDTFFPLAEQIYSNFDAMQTPLEDPAVQQRANAALQGPPQQRLVGLADALKYTEFFAARGIATDKARACLADGAKAKQVSDWAQKYSTDGINSTPTLVLNGAKLATADWPDLDAALKAAGAR